ncbi:endonuclease V [Roseomonas sp. PWR1]|uniref:Endonuclease V n=1 Tax=Roseomonas nitratireducens TaxID=2820810 RepID=A0ABS4AQ81_9PROT|nr:endonuclease V [Neoroseomonas nitratireducens]MBP0463519.1 endonuclease V [Neoroseomonas nitratireducens]
MAPETPRHWLHPATIAEARAAQAEMAARLVTEDALTARIPRLGGADVSATRFDPARRVFAAIVTLDATGDEAARATEARIADFPYIPGYLGFREVPALAACWARLSPRPDLLLVDGQGVAHPRGLGLACHLGLVLDVPTIGVAKSLLVGQAAPGPEPGDTAPILWKGRAIGVALRTRRGAGPLYVSVGHRVSLATALRMVREACDGRRLPPAIRAAHAAANDARRATMPPGPDPARA